MDAKDLRTDSALGDRNDGNTKYPQSSAVLQCNNNKSYQDIGSNPLAKVDVQTARPCAVIGPDRVVLPPTSTDAYLKKGPIDSWPAADNIYRRPPEYPHKLSDYHHTTRNISPRQTFQENMQRIMVPPSYNAGKVKDDHNFTGDQNITALRNSKINMPNEAKFCDVPYTVNPLTNDQKNTRSADISVSTLNPALARNVAQGWPGGANIRPPKPYGAPELYQYPEYSSCAGPRPMIIPRPHRTIHEDPGHVYSDAYYQDGSIRFKPYPPVKDRYPPARYEYLGNYSNPYHPPPSIPSHKYDLQKSMPPHPYPGYSQVPLKYLDTRMTEPIMNGYQRPLNPPGNFNSVPYNQVMHPSYGPVPGNCLQPNKYYSYPPDNSVKTISANKLNYDPNNKHYAEYESTRAKNYPESFYVNEMARHHSMKGQVLPPNYPAVNMHTMPPHPYYRKENPTMRGYEYNPHFRNIDPSQNGNANLLARLPSLFSPNAIAISPSDSNASNDTNQILGMSQEDCGYVSQSSTTSIRSIDSGYNRIPNDLYRRYDYKYGSVKASALLPKNDPNSNIGSKNKKDIDVRQFLQMWNEGEEENSENINKEVIAKSVPTANDITNHHAASNQEQLYVLGLVNVPSEELDKYEHIQKVSKLPENIKGYNSIELLNQFEEVIQSSNLNNFNIKPPTPRDYNVSLKGHMPLHGISIPPRPLSPLDVEAKISQSVIHKEVGCNFEIKPCSPKMLNVEVPTSAQKIISERERIIEKVTNPLKITSPNVHSVDEKSENCNVAKLKDHRMSSNDTTKASSCKMINTQYDTGNSVKTNNYSLQDLESNSGVCLASLPRLDNDIELHFPEVNQQFINANKVETVITSTPKDLPTLDVDRSDLVHNRDIRDTELDQFSANKESEKEFTKLSRYRKLKRKGSEAKEKSELSTQAMRTDSVIIKNPDNIKTHEEITELSSPLEKKVVQETQQNPMNLSVNTEQRVINDGPDDAGATIIRNELNNDEAIDFSLNSSEHVKNKDITMKTNAVSSYDTSISNLESCQISGSNKINPIKIKESHESKQIHSEVRDIINENLKTEEITNSKYYPQIIDSKDLSQLKDNCNENNEVLEQPLKVIPKSDKNQGHIGITKDIDTSFILPDTHNPKIKKSSVTGSIYHINNNTLSPGNDNGLKIKMTPGSEEPPSTRSAEEVFNFDLSNDLLSSESEMNSNTSVIYQKTTNVIQEADILFADEKCSQHGNELIGQNITKINSNNCAFPNQVINEKEINSNVQDSKLESASKFKTSDKFLCDNKQMCQNEPPKSDIIEEQLAKLHKADNFESENSVKMCDGSKTRIYTAGTKLYTVKKELFSPWIQKLILHKEGLCQSSFQNKYRRTLALSAVVESISNVPRTSSDTSEANTTVKTYVNSKIDSESILDGINVSKATYELISQTHGDICNTTTELMSEEISETKTDKYDDTVVHAIAKKLETIFSTDTISEPIVEEDKLSCPNDKSKTSNFTELVLTIKDGNDKSIQNSEKFELNSKNLSTESSEKSKLNPENLSTESNVKETIHDSGLHELTLGNSKVDVKLDVAVKKVSEPISESSDSTLCGPLISEEMSLNDTDDTIVEITTKDLVSAKTNSRTSPSYTIDEDVSTDPVPHIMSPSCIDETIVENTLKHSFSEIANSEHWNDRIRDKKIVVAVPPLNSCSGDTHAENTQSDFVSDSKDTETQTYCVRKNKITTKERKVHCHSDKRCDVNITVNRISNPKDSINDNIAHILNKSNIETPVSHSCINDTVVNYCKDNVIIKTVEESNSGFKDKAGVKIDFHADDAVDKKTTTEIPKVIPENDPLISCITTLRTTDDLIIDRTKQCILETETKETYFDYMAIYNASKKPVSEVMETDSFTDDTTVDSTSSSSSSSETSDSGSIIDDTMISTAVEDPITVLNETRYAEECVGNSTSEYSKSDIVENVLTCEVVAADVTENSTSKAIENDVTVNNTSKDSLSSNFCSDTFDTPNKETKTSLLLSNMLDNTTKNTILQESRNVSLKDENLKPQITDAVLNIKIVNDSTLKIKENVSEDATRNKNIEMKSDEKTKMSVSDEIENNAFCQAANDETIQSMSETIKDKQSQINVNEKIEQDTRFISYCSIKNSVNSSSTDSTNLCLNAKVSDSNCNSESIDKLEEQIHSPINESTVCCSTDSALEQKSKDSFTSSEVREKQPGKQLGTFLVDIARDPNNGYKKSECFNEITANVSQNIHTTFEALAEITEDSTEKQNEIDNFQVNKSKLSDFYKCAHSNRPLNRKRPFLKRSLSDSALDGSNVDFLDTTKQDDSQNSPLWPNKRKKVTDHITQPHYITEGFCNIIHHNRRNSISSIYNEESVSFCILIDNSCIITEESNDSDKICYTEIPEDCVSCITNEITNENTQTEGDIATLQEEIDCEYSDTFALDCGENEKSLEEFCVEDVACIETVVSEDIAENIIVSASNSPKNDDFSDDDSNNNEPNIFDVSEHTSKVKYIYGDKMCSDDAQLVETLYRTPQMNVNKTLIHRESPSRDDINRDFDRESLEEMLSESNAYRGKTVCDLRNNYFDPTSSKPPVEENLNPNKNSYSTPFESSKNVLNSASETELRRNERPFLLKTQDDTVHSCESSVDSVFSYNQREGAPKCAISSSPEVSSTTPEEKNSTILLKITNFKGSRIAQVSDINNGTKSNTVSCKYTEKKDYIDSNGNLPSRPLITKAAQKYIPPLKETLRDLKVRLPLPQSNLLKLKQLKVSKEKPKPNVNSHNVVQICRKETAKKPKPKFEDVLKSIDEIQFKKHKEKSKKIKKYIPKVVIKKNENGSHYASTSDGDQYNPDLTGRKWQPWVFIEKNSFIDKMALKRKLRAVYSHRKNTYVLAETFKKYKSAGPAKFVISQPRCEDSNTRQLKYTIRLKHSY